MSFKRNVRAEIGRKQKTAENCTGAFNLQCLNVRRTRLDLTNWSLLEEASQTCCLFDAINPFQMSAVASCPSVNSEAVGIKLLAGAPI